VNLFYPIFDIFYIDLKDKEDNNPTKKLIKLKVFLTVKKAICPFIILKPWPNLAEELNTFIKIYEHDLSIMWHSRHTFGKN
jgi:hypothetical protein